MCIPITLFLVLMGDDVIHLWMGAKYVQTGLMIALPLGWFFYLANVPLFNILSGFNMHGKPAIANIAVAVLAIPAAWLAISTGGGLTLLAAWVLAPIAIMNGIWMPAYACHQLKIRIGHYWREVWSVPLGCALPFGLVLFTAKRLFPTQPIAAVLTGIFIGGIVVGATYWFWALPETWRQKVRARFA
jgi:O-antigen/teichoic acid export membrane protein